MQRRHTRAGGRIFATKSAPGRGTPADHEHAPPRSGAASERPCGDALFPGGAPPSKAPELVDGPGHFLLARARLVPLHRGTPVVAHARCARNRPCLRRAEFGVLDPLFRESPPFTKLVIS